MNTISLHPSIKQVVDNGSGVLISPLGGFDVTNVVTPVQKTFDLQTLYRAIGCDYIEIVDVPETEYILVCDEEGLLKNNATLNYEATELAGRPIVGNVVLCHTSSIP
jgi:hypothetical protein